MAESSKNGKIKALSQAETAAFCSQMAMILKAGISSLEGVTLMLEESQSAEEKALLSQINETLQMSGSLAQALEESGAFPDYLLQMVKIGEYSGRLDEVMDALALHYGREADLKAGIRQALTYPLIMGFMMLLVILILLTKVMPIFQQVFEQLGSEMTGLSGAILSFGLALNRYGLVLLVLLLLFALVLFYFFKSKGGQEAFSRIFSKMSFGRKLTSQLALCRFASAMALTLSSGLTNEECLTMASSLAEQEDLKEKLALCQEDLAQGEDLSRSLLARNVFGGVYARMVAIASKTGSLDQAMREIADRYQEDSDETIQGLLNILEPSMVILLSLVVGLILLSVMLPLMGIMASL